MPKKYITIIIHTFFLLSSCTDIIEIDIPSKPGVLVIEAFLTTETSETNLVTLSRSVPYNGFFELDFEDNAMVYITTEENDTILLRSIGSGRHLLLDELNINTKYKLHTITDDDNIYTSSFQEIHTSVPIDSIIFVDQEVLLANGQSTDVTQPIGDDIKFPCISFQDPINQRNYYTWRVLATGIESNPFTWKFIDDSQFNNGSTIPFGPICFNVGIRTGSSIHIQQVSLNEESYNYYTALNDQLQGQSPFSTPPSNISSNIKCISSPELSVLGFFSIVSFSKKIAQNN